MYRLRNCFNQVIFSHKLYPASGFHIPSILAVIDLEIQPAQKRVRIAFKYTWLLRTLVAQPI